jgi:hypothetical protein
VTFVERSEAGPRTVEAPRQDPSISVFLKCFVIVVDKDKSLEKSFLPSVRALHYIEGRIDKDFSTARLTKLHEELVRTHRELTRHLSDLSHEQATRDNWMSFPALDLIRQLPRFQEYCLCVSRNCIVARTDLLNFRNRFNETIDKFRDLHATFLKGFAIPHFQANLIKSIVATDAACFLSQRKLLLAKEVAKRAGIENPHEWSALHFLEQEVVVFRSLVELAKQGQFDVIPDLIAENFDRYTIADREMTEEKAHVLVARTRAETEKDRWYGKRTKNVDTETAERLSIARKESVLALQELESVKQECEESLSESIGRISRIIEGLPNCGLIPSTFEATVRILTEKRAKKMWLQGKVNAQKERIGKLRQKVSDLQEESDQLGHMLVEKQQLFDELKTKSQTSEPIEAVLDEKYNELKSMVYCQLCNGAARKRNAFLIQCHHSFCMKCIQQQINARSRKCPYCGIRFDPAKEVQRIRWHKRKS